FAREHSVNFYAQQLYISPKYLTLMVRETTGKTAARWIDDFIIMEAKNMLRYSGKNIQQVAYALNFSNQSSFGKYFKHITGISPSEYQRS
ncbi:MAG: helix-turn-helix domain-containing protein, partial [Muribaculaceae bacterium]